MNTRAMAVAVPVVAVALLLSGCGLTTAGDGTAKLTVPKVSTEVCNQPSYIRVHAPKGFCGTPTVDPIDDDLSLGWYQRERLQEQAD
ncbi:hypothetical protein MUN74_12035 [Agromyces endophyticus]|uniref:hypothetical protein n=1 Tax=Agromyces sp. H17E-10 TaxID=2932244 RepID=UPI001FD4BD7C|nr:hypothetical protein [Agromyces sp. H17E-10]UOQ88023.1 hypothetical protein MUN74_12035 [Agromyces sp. H17E-10]